MHPPDETIILSDELRAVFKIAIQPRHVALRGGMEMCVMAMALAAEHASMGRKTVLVVNILPPIIIDNYPLENILIQHPVTGKLVTVSLANLQDSYQDMQKTPQALQIFMASQDAGLFVCSYPDLIRYANLINQRYDRLPCNLSLWLQGVEENGLFNESLRQLVGALAPVPTSRIGIVSSGATFLPSVIPEKVYPSFEFIDYRG